MADRKWYLPLDHGWMKDDKVRNLMNEGGKIAGLNWVNLLIVLQRNKGSIEWDNFGQRADAMDYTGLTECKLRSFLDLAAKHGLIDAEMWGGLGKVYNRRLVEEFALSGKRAAAGSKGGRASKTRKQNGEAKAQAS